MNTWKLTATDLFSLGMTVRGAWVYDKIPEVELLRRSLASLAGLYPYLTGRYCPAAKEVVWDETGTIAFDVTDAQEYGTAEVCGNSRLVWSLVRPFDIKGFKQGKVPPFSVTVVPLKDGAVLFLQGAHAIMDGASFYAVAGQLAQLCRGEAVVPMMLDQTLHPSGEAMGKDEAAASALAQDWARIGFSKLLKMLWNLPRNNAVKGTAVIEVPQEEIAALKKESGAGTHGILAAMAAKCFYERLGGHSSFKYVTVVDMRGRFPGVETGFMGNMSQAFRIGGEYDLSLGTAALASEISSRTREFVASDMPQQQLGLSVCVSSHHLPYFIFDPSDMNNSNPGTIYINNQLKFRACELDFGKGRPRYAFANDLADMVKIWQPVADGPIQIIFGGLAAKTMK